MLLSRALAQRPFLFCPLRPQARRTLFSTKAAGSGQQAPMSSSVRIAVGQMTSRNDTQHNFQVCKQLCEQARAQGAAMLFLPECFSFIGASQNEALTVAEPLDGSIMRRYQDLARQNQLWLSLGGFQEQGPPPPPSQGPPSVPNAAPPASDAKHPHNQTQQKDSPASAAGSPSAAPLRRMYNAHVVLNSSGDLVAHYRKIHLFDVDVPNGPVLLESRTTLPGDKLVTCDTPAGKVALTVCYDLRFPEMWQKLAFDMGAQVFTVPSAFTKATGEAHWELLCRARAVECQAFVIAAAQAGKHSEKRESFGHSIVVDPWGTVLAELDGTQTGLAVADLDFGRLEAVRQRMPIEMHRERGHKAYMDK